MQTLTEIRSLLAEAGQRPNKRLGQCFLIDLNLMQAVVDTADLTGGETILEVGPGTGSLTEALLERAGRVVSVEYDRKLAEIIERRLSGRENFTLIQTDALAGKHEIAPQVLAAVGPRAVLVSNLPYAIATPLVVEALIESWRSLRGRGVCFERLTFTVQQEVAERMAATTGKAYGSASVMLQLLGDVSLGKAIPASAFWPRPKIDSRIVRIDFAADRAGQIEDIQTLQALLHLAFTQRRKHIGTVVKARGAPFDADAFGQALSEAGIEPSTRAEDLLPAEYLELAQRLGRTIL
jgi:16S rRNA (adenine1518-N6/adenine1519-N6)-dimethyltransferase